MSEQAFMENFRKDFPSLDRTRNNQPPIYLDNACTTLVPTPVINALNEYYLDFPGCGGRRSHHWFADEVTERIEGNTEARITGSRHAMADFIHAGSAQEIIFTQNSTHAINTVALGFNFKPGDVVLVSDREHNSNLLPWLRLQSLGKVQVEIFHQDASETFDLDALEILLKSKRVRLVSLAFTSNLTGVTLPAREIVRIAHQYHARVLLDAAQTVPHQPVDVQALEVDFLTFSLHKMCGPRGVGVLYARKELLENHAGTQEDHLEPVILGGGTVSDSTYAFYQLHEAPESFEAGIQDYAGMIASGAAVEYLGKVGINHLSMHEERLNRALTQVLLERYGDTGWFHILGPVDPARRGGILSFEVRRPNAVGIADELDRKRNIMLRDGVFCVHSYFNDRYGLNWLHPRTHRDHRMIYRVSLYLYNTPAECEVFLETLDEIFHERSYI